MNLQNFLLQQENEIAKMNQQFKKFGLEMEIDENRKQETKVTLFYFSIYTAKSCIGFVYGLLLDEKEYLLIKKIFLLKQFRSAYNIQWVMQRFLQLAKQKYHVSKCKWHYAISNKLKDAYFYLLKRIPGVKVERKMSLKRYTSKTSNFDHLRQLLWYRPSLFQEKGYEAILWQNCPENVKQKILAKEEELKDDPKYLSPFIKDFETEDIKISFVLVKHDIREPFGWMINEKVSKNAAKIRRWYTYKDARALRIAPSFASFILDKIAQRRKYLIFDVAIDNLSMDKIVVNRYFRPILVEILDVYQLEIEM
ncbi:MAG: hypothetical protein LBI41_01655 [Lactobacillales bacterium]|jgi:hypothetical protein|nr:hypothetical protein [Lactobacillales bacterium]